VIAQTGEKGSGNYPNVPTFAELGFPQIPSTAYSFNARAGTPKAVIDKLYAATAQALKQPEIRAGLAKLSLDYTEPGAPDAAARNQATLAKIYSDLAKQIGIKPE
jgi:tripartite-type tricarboxylate transporter receptor subunit TctC